MANVYTSFLFFLIVSQVNANPLHECNADKELFCSKIPNKIAKTTQCLLENEDKLTDKCKLALKNETERIRNTSGNHCKEDIDHHCKWVIPGGGRILKCLFQQEENLSVNCRNLLNR